MADLNLSVHGLNNQEAIDSDQKDKLSKSFYQVLFQLENNSYINFEEKVAILITIWRSLAKISSFLQEVPEIYMFVLQESSQVILSNQWKNLTASTKRCMAKMLIYGSHVVSPLIRGSTLMCAAALVMAVYDPWGDPTLKKALAGEDDLDETTVLEYLANEPAELFGFRIEILIKEEHEDTALIFCQWGLNQIRKIISSHKISDSSNTHDENNVLKIIENLEPLFLSWEILLLHRKERLHDIVKEASKCTCHQGVQLIHSMKSKRLSNALAVSEILINLFLVQDLLYPSSYCCTKELMSLWCDMQVEQQRSLEDVKQSSYRLLVQYASTSAHFYLFVDCLWEKFGCKFLSLYLELYFHGLTGDLNHLDAARQNDDRDVVLDMESHLAAIFTKLSSLFASHEIIAQECVLSAFSLEPTKERLELLQKLRTKCDKQNSMVDFAMNSSSNEQRKECKCNGRCSTPEKAQQINFHHYYHPVLDTEVPGLTKDQLSDFVMVLESVRFHYLKFPNNQEELKQVCEDYLETASALRTLFTHTSYCGSADSETDSISENQLRIQSERLSCLNAKDSKNKSISPGSFENVISPNTLEKVIRSRTAEKINTKLPFDLLNRIHSTVFSKCKADNFRRHNNKENPKKKSKINKKSHIKDIQKRKKKKKRKLKREKDNETTAKNKMENDCQEVQKIKKKKKKAHKKIKVKSNKHNALQSTETSMGSLELAAMISNNAGILFSKFHANFAMSSKFCENTSLITSCLHNPINPVVVLSDILSHKPVAIKKSHKSSGHNKKLKKNKLKLKNKHKLAKLKKKHNKNRKKFQKNKDASKKHIASYSMITSGTDILQNANGSLMLSQNNPKQLTHCFSGEGNSIENLSIVGNISKDTQKTIATCNITPSYQTCSPTLFQTMPILIPASIPCQVSSDSNAAPPALMKEASKDENKFFMPNIVTENITQLNSVNSSVQALPSFKEPINATSGSISTCVLVERRQTTIVSSVITPTSNYQTTSTKVLQTKYSSSDTSPLNHTIIAGKIPNQTVILPSSTQGAVSVPKYPELLHKPSDGVVQNVPTVATLTIPIAPTQQNGAGNRVVAGRLVIPVGLNCAGVKTVFPSSALVQSRSSMPNNCNQQAMAFPGVIIVRSNNPGSKETNRGKVFLPSATSKGKKPIQPIWKNKSIQSQKKGYQEIASKRSMQVPVKVSDSKSRSTTTQLNRKKASNIHASTVSTNLQKPPQQRYNQKNSTITTSLAAFPSVTTYLHTTSVATLVSSKPYYSTAELSNTLTSINHASVTPMCSPSEQQHPSKKPQPWNGLNVNNQATETTKSMQVEDSLMPTVTSCTATTETHTASTRSTVITPSMAASQCTPQVHYDRTESKLNSAMPSTAEMPYQQMISTENTEPARNETLDNSLLLMDHPNRSLSSISDAVRVSLMVMDDETEGAESQNIQPYSYNPSDNIGYTTQENNRPLCSEFVPENIQMQQSSILINSNESSQLYQPVSSCQMIENYNQPAATPTTNNWSSTVNTCKETEEEELQNKSCRNGLTNEENVEDSKKQKKDVPKKSKDSCHSSSSSVSNRFWCKLCQRGFFSAYNLRRHCKNVHKMELPPTRPLGEPHSLYQKTDGQICDQQHHKQANSHSDIPQSSALSKPFSPCSRPQSREDNPSSQNEASSNMNHMVTNLSRSKHCLKNGVSGKRVSKTSSQVCMYDSDQSSSRITSNPSFGSRSHSRPKKKGTPLKQQPSSSQLTVLSSQADLPSFQASNDEVHMRSSQQSAVTVASTFVQNITSSTQAATLSSGTNDSLEDLEQFLMENLSWGSDQGAAQSNSMHPERSASADSLSLPVNLSPGVKATPRNTEKSVAIDYSAKSECKTLRCQNGNVSPCNNSKEDNICKEVALCSSKSTSEKRVDQAMLSSKKNLYSNEQVLLSTPERSAENFHKSKQKSDSLHKDQSLQMQNIDKILDLGKLSMCDETESSPSNENCCVNFTTPASEQNCQTKKPVKNCALNTSRKSECCRNVSENMQKGTVIPQVEKSSHDEDIEVQPDSLTNDNSRELDASRNGSPSALSDISHMLNECRIEISPPCKTEEPSKHKNMIVLERVSSFLTCDDSCRSFQDEMQDSNESEIGKDGLTDQNSVLMRPETYHCKWENEHYDPETDLARGRTRSRETGKVLKRICQCCEDSNLISRKCRKNSGSSSGSANVTITKIMRNNIKRNKLLHQVSKSKIAHARSSQRPRTRSTTIS